MAAPASLSALGTASEEGWYCYLGVRGEQVSREAKLILSESGRQGKQPDPDAADPGASISLFFFFFFFFFSFLFFLSFFFFFFWSF